LIALGNGTNKLPIKTDIRQAIGKDVGYTVGTTLFPSNPGLFFLKRNDPSVRRASGFVQVGW
jgi:hypothetical protein